MRARAKKRVEIFAELRSFDTLYNDKYVRKHQRVKDKPLAIPASDAVNNVRGRVCFCKRHSAKKRGQSYWELVNYQKGKIKASQVALMSMVVLALGMDGMFFSARDFCNI